MDSHITYASIIWGKNIDTINRLFLLQNKAIRTINFKERCAQTNALFQNYDIIKLSDRIKSANRFMISNYVHIKLPSIFNNWVTFSSNFHQYETCFVIKGHLKVPSVKTTSCGNGVHYSSVIKTWNDIEKITVLMNRDNKSVSWNDKLNLEV